MLSGQRRKGEIRYKREKWIGRKKKEKKGETDRERERD